MGQMKFTDYDPYPSTEGDYGVTTQASGEPSSYRTGLAGNIEVVRNLIPRVGEAVSSGLLKGAEELSNLWGLLPYLTNEKYRFGFAPEFEPRGALERGLYTGSRYVADVVPFGGAPSLARFGLVTALRSRAARDLLAKRAPALAKKLLRTSPGESLKLGVHTELGAAAGAGAASAIAPDSGLAELGGALTGGIAGGVLGLRRLPKRAPIGDDAEAIHSALGTSMGRPTSKGQYPLPDLPDTPLSHYAKLRQQFVDSWDGYTDLQSKVLKILQKPLPKGVSLGAVLGATSAGAVSKSQHVAQLLIQDLYSVLETPTKMASLLRLLPSGLSERLKKVGFGRAVAKVDLNAADDYALLLAIKGRLASQKGKGRIHTVVHGMLDSDGKPIKWTNEMIEEHIGILRGKWEDRGKDWRLLDLNEKDSVMHKWKMRTDEMLDNYVEAGMLEKNFANKLKTRQDFYSPFNVMKQMSDEYTGFIESGVLGPKDLWQRQKGLFDEGAELLPMTEGLSSYIQKGHLAISHNNRNKTIAELSRLVKEEAKSAKEFGPASRYARLLAPASIFKGAAHSAHSLNIGKRKIEDFAKDWVKNSKEYIVQLNKSDLPAPKGMTKTYYRERVIEKGKETVKLRAVAINNDYVSAIKRASQEEASFILKSAISFGNIFRLGATGANFAFMMPNFIADGMRATFISAAGPTNPADLFRFGAAHYQALKSTFKANFLDFQDDVYQRASIAGVLNSDRTSAFAPQGALDPMKLKSLGGKVLSSIPKFTKTIEDMWKVAGVTRGLKVSPELKGLTTKELKELGDEGPKGAAVAARLGERERILAQSSLEIPLADWDQRERSGLKAYYERLPQAKADLKFKKQMRRLMSRDADTAREALWELQIEIRRYAGSPDFARRGSLLRGKRLQNLNLLFMFANARIQGTVSDYDRLTIPFRRMRKGHSLSKKDISSANRAFANLSTFIGIPTLYLLSVNLGSKENRDNYFKIPEWERERNWMIPIPGKFLQNEEGEMIQDYFRIPKRDPFRLFANSLEGIYKQFLSPHTEHGIPEKERETFREWATGFAGNIIEESLPVETGGETLGERVESVASSVNPAFRVPIESIANRSFWRHRPIVPEYVRAPGGKALRSEYLKAHQVYKQGTHELYKGLSRFAGRKGIEITPLKIKHFLEGYTGNLIAQLFPSTNRKVLEGVFNVQTVPIVGDVVKRFQRSAYIDKSKDFKRLREAMGKQEFDGWVDNEFASRFIDVMYNPLSKVSSEKREAILQDYRSNIGFQKEVANILKDTRLGRTSLDRMIMRLKVDKGNRAKLMADILNDLPPEDRNIQWNDWARKGMLKNKLIQGQISYWMGQNNK